MPNYTTINKSSDNFNTKLYTGNGTTNHAITGVGFQPDFNWTKARTDTDAHTLTDAVRGATKYIMSSSSDGNNTNAEFLKSFDSDGFTLGNNARLNYNNYTYASWNWKAGTTGSGTTGGSGSAQSYSYSVNTTSGFSIVKYTGNATAGHTIPHHLGAVPKMILFKQLTGANVDWRVYHESIGNTHRLCLNDTSASNNDDSAFNDTSPTSSVFTVGGSSSTNPSADMIAYCFAEKTGYSKFGSYTGNGNADGTFIYTGFKPAFVIVKIAEHAGNWQLFDNKRVGYNQDNHVLRPNLNNAECTSCVEIDILSNGFKLRNTDGDGNTVNNKYLYMAFGQSLVGSNNVPCTAR